MAIPPLDDPVPVGWSTALADAIAASLREFAPRLQGTTITRLQVICLPWHGLLSLAILTADEVAADAGLDDPRMTMDWQHGEFTEEVAAWHSTTPLAQAMRAAYYSSSDCPTTAVAFLQASAQAAASPAVAAAIALLERAEGFRISVIHPDDRQEFFPPGG